VNELRVGPERPNHVRPWAEQLIGDIDAIEQTRNLAAYERNARLVAREYLKLLNAAQEAGQDSG